MTIRSVLKVIKWCTVREGVFGLPLFEGGGGTLLGFLVVVCRGKGAREGLTGSFLGEGGRLARVSLDKLARCRVFSLVVVCNLTHLVYVKS